MIFSGSLNLALGGFLWNEKCWHLPSVGGFSSVKSSKTLLVYPLRGTGTPSQGYTVVSWLLLTGLCIPSLPDSVQLLSCVRLFVTPWTAAHQASLSITNSWSLLKLMSVESVMPSNHLILCCPCLLLPLIFPSFKVFSNESVFTSGGQNIGVSASTLDLLINIQDWFPWGFTGWISLQSKGLSRVFSNTTVQKHQFFGTQLSL